MPAFATQVPFFSPSRRRADHVQATFCFVEHTMLYDHLLYVYVYVFGQEAFLNLDTFRHSLKNANSTGPC